MFGGALGALTYEHIFSSQATSATCKNTLLQAATLGDPESARQPVDIDDDIICMASPDKRNRLVKISDRDIDDGSKEKFIMEESEK